jgi:hypothetical protein
LTKWEVVCTPKDQGGLGVLNLEIHNKCLLSKWLFKLINGDVVWQQLLKNKYLRNKNLTQVQYMPGDTQFWAGLMKVKKEFLSLGKFDLGNESQVRFWEDSWIRSRPLKSFFPTVYNIVRRKNASVRSVMSTIPLNVAFRRSLIGVNLQAWHSVVAMVANIQLTNQRDRFMWGLHQNGLFSVKSMYRALLGTQALSYNTFIWKLKLPLKIKVFLWHLYKGVVLTKDNLARRQWQGDRKCYFCFSNESIQRLFFYCHFAKFIRKIVHVSFNLSSPTSIHNIFLDWLEGINRKLKSKIIVGASALCWAIWLSRNDIVFNKTVSPFYLQAIFRGTYWTGFWSRLQKEEDRQFMKMGCETIETVAMEVFARHDWSFSNRIAI